MRKINSFLIIIIEVGFCVCSLLLSSCNEDSVLSPPIDTNYHYDSSRFNWKVDTLLGEGYYYKLWAPDTNEIFIANQFTNTLAHIKNGEKTYTQYPQENRLGAVFGDESNNGFRVGAILVGTIYQPLIQRWDGNNFININNPQNMDRNFFYWDAYIKNQNEIWIGLTDGTIVKYDGADFTHYDLSNPNLVYTKFYYDESNKLKFLAYDQHQEKGYTEYFVYEFENNNWVKIFRDSVNDIIGPIRYNDVIGKSIAPLGLSEIYELVNNNSIPRISIPVFSFYLSVAGSSYSNVLIPASESFSECKASLFHWNGEKWSLELCNYNVQFAVQTLMINENLFYVISYDLIWRETYVMRGIKKY